MWPSGTIHYDKRTKYIDWPSQAMCSNTTVSQHFMSLMASHRETAEWQVDAGWWSPAASRRMWGGTGCPLRHCLTPLPPSFLPQSGSEDLAVLLPRGSSPLFPGCSAYEALWTSGLRVKGFLPVFTGSLIPRDKEDSLPGILPFSKQWLPVTPQVEVIFTELMMDPVVWYVAYSRHLHMIIGRMGGCPLICELFCCPDDYF